MQSHKPLGTHLAQIGVVAHNEGILAAQLKHHGRQVLGSCLHDLARGGTRVGEKWVAIGTSKNEEGQLAVVAPHAVMSAPSQHMSVRLE